MFSSTAFTQSIAKIESEMYGVKGEGTHLASQSSPLEVPDGILGVGWK